MHHSQSLSRTAAPPGAEGLPPLGPGPVRSGRPPNEKYNHFNHNFTSTALGERLRLSDESLLFQSNPQSVHFCILHSTPSSSTLRGYVFSSGQRRTTVSQTNLYDKRRGFHSNPAARRRGALYTTRHERVRSTCVNPTLWS